MDESVIMLVIVVILIAALGISFMISKKKGKNTGNQKNGSTSSTKAGGKGENVVPRKDMSEFINFDKIANDMIYQKKGEKYTMVIQCKGVNYDLMSNIEQMSVEEGFIKFLNTLRTQIQLYVQTRTINLTENINKYKERTAAFNDMYADYTNRYNMAEEDIDVSKEDTEALRLEKIKYGNIAEYASDITRYVERLSLNKYMLQRNYYIILSYYKSELATTEKFTKEEYEELCYRELYTKAQGVISSLSTCSVTGRILNSNELAELIYISYNRDDQRTMDIKSALESGFYRLYTTSEDVRAKKQELLDEEIRKEAAARVEQAIQDGLKNGTLLTPEQAEAQIDKEIDTQAINIVNEADISNKTKERVKDQILRNRKERIEKAKEQKVKQNEGLTDDRLPEKEENEEKVNDIQEEVQGPQLIKPEEKEVEEIKEVKEEKNETESNSSKKEKKVEEEKTVKDEKVEKNEKNETVNNEGIGGLGDREDTFGSMNDEIDARESIISNVSINQEESKENLTYDGSFDNTETEVKKTVEESEDDSIV